MNLEAYGIIIIMQTFEALIEITFLKYSKKYVKVKKKPRQLNKLTKTTLMNLLLFSDLLTSILLILATGGRTYDSSLPYTTPNR